MNRKKAEKALKVLAERDGVTVDYVRKKIQEAIDIGMADPHPLRNKFWTTIPHKGDRPSPEDVICFLADRIDK